jgi:hypothetical protein
MLYKLKYYYWKLKRRVWPVLVGLYVIGSTIATFYLIERIDRREDEHNVAAEQILQYENRMRRIEALWGINDRLR